MSTECVGKITTEDVHEAVRLCNSANVLVAETLPEHRVAQLLANERVRGPMCGDRNGHYICNLPKGHAESHQSVNTSGNGGSIGWSKR